MPKRIADKELTDRNWFQEDEVEEAENSSAFKGFKGLVVPSGSKTGFSGFGNGFGLKSLQGVSNGNGGSSGPSPFTGFKASESNIGVFGSDSSALGFFQKKDAATKLNGKNEASHSSSTPPLSRTCGNSTEYNKQLTALNCSVRDWIQKHVNENPLCDLTPIFRDYEKHLASIEQKYGSSSDSGSESDTSGKKIETPSALTLGALPQQVPAASTPLFSFTSKKESIPDKMAKLSRTASEFAGGIGKKGNSGLRSLGSGAVPSFSFSSGGSSSLFGKDPNQVKPVATSFSFTSSESKPKGETQEETKGDPEDKDEESEEPPKNVVNEIKEDDAFYSKKCKLFYKKDNEFKEKGVGMLHLKPVDKKTQLLVRADTNLGNILLNIFVQPSMPCTRTGKNNILIVCVPNPAVDEKNPTIPVPVLIRVKTSDDADELHKILLEKKEA
ncbi:nuclear pore complex protein Nup50 isoform X2 [Latimeria chalumnae]|uniref:nuclear pore complex protein Nup50 isoform X2 n=1 Tax=Latimeria chalumnae TaxID=7897 RepID=UPI0003C11AD7|nr:PREDICTED: nuclear pore complex protein Nup50 isoform X2 [Latimeria chalumnae]XP_014342540.1 PREDICTED: nuclear pore complex protein Nup50 isoform X2 [Latimeria chalumnae]|eukprot:XP_005993729.1 PREDICTED: nuclear pore complex protein Nup50 isoform X2 [Latimeria chalumnae]